MSATSTFATTSHLDLTPVPVGFRPDELLATFRTNPAFLEASRLPPQFDRDDVAQVLFEEENREKPRCLVVRLRPEGNAIGTIALQVPHPATACPGSDC